MTSPMKEYWKNYIGGKWVDGSGGGRIKLLNPAPGKPLAEVARATVADVDSAVAAARDCVRSRALVDMRPMDRGRMIARMGRLLRDRTEEIATLITLDAGKRISKARAQSPVGAGSTATGSSWRRGAGELLPVEKRRNETPAILLNDLPDTRDRGCPAVCGEPT